jgi:hypothetical protein
MTFPDVEVFAEQILDATGQHKPPMDIRAMLRNWTSLSVVETDLDGDGFFVDLGDLGGEILLKKDKEEIRKRFTLAHELGHFLLRHHIGTDPKNQQIEKWCNDFAASLLLPRSMVADHLKQEGRKGLTEQLCKGPRIFQVSEKTFYLRIVRLFPISIMSVLVSRSGALVVDRYFNKDLLGYLGDDTELLDSEAQKFLVNLRDEGVGQSEFKRPTHSWLARRTENGEETQKFLLAVIERT